jgi:type IV pilus assembly protein PilE
MAATEMTNPMTTATPNPMPTPARRERGFTLIELMIVMAIVAILSSIAYPAYKESVARSRRADAKAVLLETAQWLERQYTVSQSYAKMGDGATIGDVPYTEAPRTGSNKAYTISFAASSATGYTLQAVPKNAMASDKCGTFKLTQTGAKSLGNDAIANVNDCWER